MSMQKRLPVLFLAMVSLVLLISACSPSIATGGNTQSSLSVGDVLLKSAATMKQLKSSHIDLQSIVNTQTSGGTVTTGTTTTAIPENVNLNIKGSGDQQLPDQEQMNLTINTNTNVVEILQGDKVYIKNQQGRWYVLDKSALQGLVGNPLSGIRIDQNSLLAMLQNIKITDNGDQNLSGQSLRHITAQLDKDALRQLVSANPQLKNALGTTNTDAILNNTKSFLSTVDVWIDETNFYIHRTELKINLDADTSSIGNGAPTSVKSNIDTIVDLSKFNEAVTITPPTNAIPTNDPATVLGKTSTQ
jgi:hypothetical protein